MLVLLPPSETKRQGGRPAAVALGADWRFAQLSAARERVISALVALSSDRDTAARVLALSARQLGEIEVNAQLRSAAVMPAIDRYTGVLYDALDAATLDAKARGWLRANVAIHSAPFGPVGAMDQIPAYRLGATASLPGLTSLKREWSEAVSAAIAASEPTFVMDLRSEAYRALGPVPETVPSVFVRVVTEGADGAARALNHFNKHAKGALVRELAQARPRVRSIRGMLAALRELGHRVEEADGEWLLYERFGAT